MNRNVHLESLRKKLIKVTATENLESLAHDRAAAPATEAALESVRARRVATEAPDVTNGSADAEAKALRKLANGDFDDLSPREQFQLEAIVEETGRPVSFIEGGLFQALPQPWTHYNDPAGPIRQRILSAIPMIGRVEAAPFAPGEAPQHLGTGFIVGQNLMMTNRHVAELFVRGVGRSRTRLSFVSGVATAIDFKREKGFSASDRSANVAITEIVMVHPYWDMALFRVANLPAGTGSLQLSVVPPEDLGESEVAVIGYPGRSRDRSPRAVELERKYFGSIFGVKRLAPGEIRERERIESFDHQVSAMTHDSSTLPGNSGAAILNVATGEIVGLHFAGITLKANYSVPTFELARDSRVVDAGLNFRGTTGPTSDWENFWKVADPETELRTAAPTAVPTPSQGVSLTQIGTVKWTIPITISISLGDIPSSVPVAPPTSSGVPSLFEASFQVPIIHPGLESRAGYDPGFLDLDGDEKVPLPNLTNNGTAAVSRLQDGTFELKYHRFSVVVHKKRRLALFTASNVNWQSADRRVNGHKPTREELTGIPSGVLEEWVTDPRIPEAEQLPDVFFTRDQGAFDKGHLVRRDDVAWGGSFDEMQKGNGDTYHTTNCSPQVAKFNQSARGVDNWGDLENMVQQQTSAERVIIFSGPVLDISDRIFKGVDGSGVVKIQIPKQFWKIVVAKTDDGPRAFGFTLKQKLTGVPLEFTVPEDWQPFQTTIQEIEDMMFGLAKLDWCKEHDALTL